MQTALTPISYNILIQFKIATSTFYFTGITIIPTNVGFHANSSSCIRSALCQFKLRSFTPAFGLKSSICDFRKGNTTTIRTHPEKEIEKFIGGTKGSLRRLLNAAHLSAPAFPSQPTNPTYTHYATTALQTRPSKPATAFFRIIKRYPHGPRPRRLQPHSRPRTRTRSI